MFIFERFIFWEEHCFLELLFHCSLFLRWDLANEWLFIALTSFTHWFGFWLILSKVLTWIHHCFRNYTSFFMLPMSSASLANLTYFILWKFNLFIWKWMYLYIFVIYSNFLFLEEIWLKALINLFNLLPIYFNE